MKRHFIFALLFSIAACSDKNKPSDNPAHYDLGKSEKFVLPGVLHEISGIAFNNKNSDTIYAEQDEEGRLFHFKIGDKAIMPAKFGKKGDYEDVTIFKGTVIMLRSDGMLVTFPLNEANNEAISTVLEWKNILPDGEYEGLFADGKTGLLHVLCKQCGGEKSDRTTSGYLFTISEKGTLAAAGNFTLNVKEIEALAGVKKMKFRPSALARNTLTGEWFILSSVNSMIVITDGNWKVKKIVPLDRSVFNQPEGIAFDLQHNLYISNEGSPGVPANILKFHFQR